MNTLPAAPILEDIFEGIDEVAVIKSIDALAESNPKLLVAIQSHFSVDDKKVPTKRMSSYRQKSTKFSLDTMAPTVAEIMAIFDFNGDGNVSMDEVRQGAQMLKSAKKKNKIVVTAMIVQFVVYAALTLASCGALYYFLYQMKDTTVDQSTGMLMTKTHDGSVSNEISVKSHGKGFSADFSVDDLVTGNPKVCVNSDSATEMFKAVAEGTPTKFLAEDTASGALTVTTIGSGTASWTDSKIDFGEFSLIPDADCTERYLERHESGGHRRLSPEKLFDRHLAERNRFLLSTKETDGGIVHRGLGDLNRLLQVTSREGKFGFTVSKY